MQDNNTHKQKGIIHKIYPEDYVQTKKGIFPKRTVVVEVRSDKNGYDRTSLIALELFGDRAKGYESYFAGDEVEFMYTIQSRMSLRNGEEKWWTSINCSSLSKKFEFDSPARSFDDVAPKLNTDIQDEYIPKAGDKYSNEDDLPF